MVLFDTFIELMKVRNESHCCILFKMMKVGAAHSLSLIHFNIPNLMSLSNSTFRVRSCIFGNRVRSAMIWLSTFLKFDIVGFVIPHPQSAI